MPFVQLCSVYGERLLWWTWLLTFMSRLGGVTAALFDRLKVFLQYTLPKQHLTMIAGRIAGTQHRWMAPRLIRAFDRTYGVDMSEAEHEDLGSYTSFDDGPQTASPADHS